MRSRVRRGAHDPRTDPTKEAPHRNDRHRRHRDRPDRPAAIRLARLKLRLLGDAARALRRQFDPEWGGFGGAPKFPPAPSLEFLLRQHLRGDDDALLPDGTLVLENEETPFRWRVRDWGQPSGGEISLCLRVDAVDEDDRCVHLTMRRRDR